MSEEEAALPAPGFGLNDQLTLPLLRNVDEQKGEGSTATTCSTGKRVLQHAATDQPHSQVAAGNGEGHTLLRRFSSRFTELTSSPASSHTIRKMRTMKQNVMDSVLHHMLPDSVRSSPQRTISKSLSKSSSPAEIDDHPFRLIDRDAPFRQSLGTMKIVRENREHEYFFSDPFHLLVEWSTCSLLSLFWTVYSLTFMFFALVFWSASDCCHIGCDTYIQALLLTVETMLTIGYGVPDPYFRDCPWLSVFLIVQCLVAVMYDASFVGLIYQRVSRGTTRASTVLFSDKAVLREIDGSLYLMFRVCEMRRTQLLSAHIRCYFFSRRRVELDDLEEGKNIVSQIRQEPMRIERPDDNIGASTLLILPTTIVHRVDKFSPLVGRPRESAGALAATQERIEFAPLQRASEGDLGCRDGAWCKVCGSTFAVEEQLRKHIDFTAAQEARDGEVDPPHGALVGETAAGHIVKELRERLQNYWANHDVEVVCIVEGVDASTSNTVQARHSYAASDIVFDADFAPCMTTDGRCVVLDFAHFHNLVTS